MQLGEDLARRSAEGEPQPARAVVEAGVVEVLEPDDLTLPVVQPLDDVQLQPPELVEDQGAAAEDLQRRGGVEIRGQRLALRAPRARLRVSWSI